MVQSNKHPSRHPALSNMTSVTCPLRPRTNKLMDLIGCRIACPKEPAPKSIMSFSKDDKVAVSKIPRMAYSVAWAVFRTGNSMLSAYFVRSISDMEEKSGTKTLPTVMPTRRLVLVDSVAGCAEKEKSDASRGWKG